MRATALIIVLVLLSGCQGMLRAKGQPYRGYTCRESLVYYYSHCSTAPITQEMLESRVSTCEKNLSDGICDKELADLLWHMGRATPTTYTSPSGLLSSSTYNGCDCLAPAGDLKQCQMEHGIFPAENPLLN